MSNLTKDELGFIRVSRYGRMSRKELEDWMELQPGEAVYHSGVKRGVRVSESVKEQEVELKPGDTLSVGPVITKAASSGEPDWLRRERLALSRAGYGGVGKTVRTQWGWALLLKGLTLPGGVRTEALVLLPKELPANESYRLLHSRSGRPRRPRSRTPLLPADLSRSPGSFRAWLALVLRRGRWRPLAS